MTSPRVEVLLWAKRIVAKKAADAHVLLEVHADATVDQAQEAFYKIARIAHPDLHRTTLGADELELVTSAYAQVANAYQQFRSAKQQTSRLAAVKQAPAAEPRTKRASAIQLPGGGVIRGAGITRPPANVASTVPHAAPTASPAAPAPAPEPAAPTASHAASQMNGKALLYYRKAEMALRQGDVRAGMLNLKMAIAADPASTFLRAALAEVDAEMGKKNP